MHARKFGAVAIAVIAVVSLSGCGGSDAHQAKKITIDGVEVKDPGKALATAKSQFLAANRSAIDSKAAVVSDKSDCFFRHTEKGSKDFVPGIFCGPIKRAGASAGHVWDVYSATILGTDDPTATGGVSVSGPKQTGQPVDTALLVRPDGAGPADGKDLAEPQAPEASFHDYAYLMPSGKVQTGLTFTDLKQPARLVTPAATISVTATATSATVPGWFADAAAGEQSDDSASDDSSGAPGAPSKTDVFRPAAGQEVLAYKVTIGPGSAYPDPNTSGGWGSSSDRKDASTQLSLAITGQQLSIHHESSDDTFGTTDSDNATMTIKCESVPCAKDDAASADNTDYILIASVPKGSKPAISASVDGHTLSVPASGGEVNSDVSAVNQTRKSPVQQVNSTIPSKKWQSGDDWSDVTYTAGGSIPVAFLAAFDPQKGWAPKGQAWLEIPVSDAPNNDDAFKVSWSKTMTVSADGKTYDADTDAGLDGSFGILVPDTFTTGTLTYAPQGSVTYGYPEKTSHFAVDPFTVKLSIPQ